jgi:sigma-E factor negative regulatory protein RseC
MRTESGTVVEIKNDYAVIEMTPHDACASCAAKNACTSLGGGTKRISVKNECAARTGDAVEFSISNKGSLFSACIVYGLPVLLLFIGMLAAPQIAGSGSDASDNASAIGGFAGILVSLVIIKLINPIIKKMDVFQVKMTRIIARNGNK